MLVRVVDAKRAVLEVDAARSHGVVVIEELPQLGVLEKRLMRYLRPPADIANLYRSRLIERCGRETRHVNRDRQIGTRPTSDACDFLDAVTASNKNVVKAGQ